MKSRLTTLALTIMVGATFAMAAQPVKKKNPKLVTSQTAPLVRLTSASDSVSYAAGMTRTDGLMQYITSQLNVDTAYMADFMRGVKEALGKSQNKQFKAYAAGLQVADMLNSRMLTGLTNEFKGSPDSINAGLFRQGFIASLENNHSLMTDSAALAYFRKRHEADMDAKKENLYGSNRKAGEDFLAANAKKDGVVTLPSGLQYKVLVMGEGPVAKATDKVTVKYEGTLTDGTVFDSSYKRNPQTSEFRANEVIKGWTEALTRMPAGSTWMLYIPQQLAYGSRQAGKIQPYSTLIFKVELVSVNGKTTK